MEVTTELGRKTPLPIWVLIIFLCFHDWDTLLIMDTNFNSKKQNQNISHDDGEQNTSEFKHFMLPPSIDSTSCDIEFEDYLKPNRNHTKFSSKMVKKVRPQAKVKVNTIAWNGDDVDDAQLLKFARAKQIKDDRLKTVAKYLDVQRDKRRHERVKQSQKGKKYEFTFDKNGNVNFESTISDIGLFVSDIIVAIVNLGLNPTFSVFVTQIYFLCRLYVSKTTFESVKEYVEAVYLRHTKPNDIKSVRNKLMDGPEVLDGTQTITPYDALKFLEFCKNPKNQVFPEFEGLQDNCSVLEHYKAWIVLGEKNPDIAVKSIKYEKEILRYASLCYAKLDLVYADVARRLLEVFIGRDSFDTLVDLLNGYFFFFKIDFTEGLSVDEYVSNVREEAAVVSRLNGDNCDACLNVDLYCQRHGLEYISRVVRSMSERLCSLEIKDNNMMVLYDQEGNRFRDYTLEGPKEDAIDGFFKVVTNKDSVVFDDSDFGRSSRRVLNSITLAPFILAAGGIKRLDQYDDWYNRNCGTVDRATGFVGLVGKWIYSFLKSGLPYLISGDSIFLNPIKDFERWLEVSERIIREISDKPTLSNLANDISYNQLCTLVSALSKTGRDLLAGAKSAPIVAAKVQNMIHKLGSLYPMLRNYFKGKMIRSQPMGVFIYGPAGSGKSSIVHSCIAITAENLNISNHGNAAYNINTSTKHMDGYREERIGLIDDVGSANVKVAPDEVMAKICSICSEFSMVTPQADLPDKGNITYNFDVIIATSNFPDGNFRAVMNNPSAGMRRFEIFIEVIVNDVHLLSKRGGGQINNAGGRIKISDLHTYNVFRPIAVNNMTTEFEFHKFSGVEMAGVNYDTLCRFLKHYHNDFIDRSDKARFATNDLIGSKWCNEHNRLTHVCGLEGLNCLEMVREPAQEYKNLYQFVEVVDVNTFDFKRFMNIQFGECAVKDCLNAMSLPADDVQPVGFFDNLNKAKAIRDARVGIMGEVVLEGWLSEKVHKALTYPIRCCVSSVIDDESIRGKMRDVISENVNDLVNTFTQESPLNVAADNAIKANIPVVTEAIKTTRDRIAKSCYEIAGITVGSILGFFALYKTVRVFVKHVNSTYNLQFSGAGFRKNDEDYFKTYKQTDTQIGAMQSDQPPHPITRPKGLQVEALTLTRLQSNQIQPFNDLIRSNIVEYFVQIGDHLKRGVGVVLGSNIVFTTAHTFKSLPDDAAIKIIFLTHNMKFNMTLIRDYIYFFKDRDLCGFSTGSNAFKMITRILPETDTSKFVGPVEFVTSRSDESQRFRSVTMSSVSIYTPNKTIVTDSNLPYLDYYNSGATVNGDCGSPIVSTGDFSSLIGIHCGSFNDRPIKHGMKACFLVRIYPTDLEEAKVGILAQSCMVTPNSFPDNKPVGLEGVNLESFKEGSFAVHIRGYVTPVAWVENKCTVKSRIRRSLIYEFLNQDKYKIPDFHSYITNDVSGVPQYVNPVLTKFRAIEDSPRMINPLILKKARLILSDIMDSWCDWNDIRPCSFSNVLNGIAGTISGAINLSTAPGPRYRVKLKRDLVFEGDKPGDRQLHEDVYENVFKSLQAYKAGFTAGHMSKAFPKDEPITIEKELTGRQRYVYLTPFEKLVLTLMPLKNVFIAIRQSGKAHMAVGANAADPKCWGGFVEKLATMDPSLAFLVDSDYRFYDAYIWFVTLILGIIISKLENNPWYNVEIEFQYRDKVVCMSMLDVLKSVAGDISQYFVLVDGVLVYVVNVTESGGACTAEINSVMESFLHILIYIVTWLDSRRSDDSPLLFHDAIKGMPDFDKNVALINYGDDNVDSAREQVRIFYNPSSRGKAAKQLGFPITDARKNPELTFVTIDKVVFLKRSFRYDEELKCWMAPLDEASILKLMAFIKGNSSTLEALTVNNARDALHQYFMYGRDRFDREREHIFELLKMKGLERFIQSWPTFDALREDYLKGCIEMGSL